MKIMAEHAGSRLDGTCLEVLKVRRSNKVEELRFAAATA
jgi:hypothetical protein